MSQSLFLVANPGSASRKYALFENTDQLAKLHFEHEGDRIICTLERGDERTEIPTSISNLDQATGQIVPILESHELLGDDKRIEAIGLRVVAPGSYFLGNHLVDDDFLMHLEAARDRAPLHITSTLTELDLLRQQFAGTNIFGISDSTFHITKPDYAWNYGISLDIADTHDIKRFGYHGLSVASVIRQTLLPHKVIVCHLGSGASITAVYAEKSLDNTMGYTPLEGLIMGTRSGSIDASALGVLKQIANLDDHDLEIYLNQQSGLLGLGGSADVRELLEREATGDTKAALALSTFIYSIQKGIGSMTAALDGADAVVFTGTIGERSAAMRQRIVARLAYLGFTLDPTKNTISSPTSAIQLQAIGSKPIYVIPTHEEQEIVQQMLSLTSA